MALSRGHGWGQKVGPRDVAWTMRWNFGGLVRAKRHDQGQEVGPGGVVRAKRWDLGVWLGQDRT